MSLMEKLIPRKTVSERIYDGDQARQVLENEAFAAAFNDIRQEYTNAWMESPARDAEGREKLYLMLKLTDKLQTTLTGAMQDGRIAQEQLRHEQTMAERAKSAIGWT